MISMKTQSQTVSASTSAQLPKMDLQHMESQSGKANHKRKIVELGLGLFSSSQRNGSALGSSIRSQSKNLLSSITKPFHESSKKKSRRNQSGKVATSCSNDSKRSQRSETSKKFARSNENESSMLNFEGGKHYSRIENVVLVGEIFTQLFISPALKKHTWVAIAKNLEKFFEQNRSQQQTCVRTSGALARHSKF